MVKIIPDVRFVRHFEIAEMITIFLIYFIIVKILNFTVTRPSKYSRIGESDGFLFSFFFALPLNFGRRSRIDMASFKVSSAFGISIAI